MDACDLPRPGRRERVKLDFLELPEPERRLYTEEAAARRGVSPVIIEKDFWVCWVLAILFRSEVAESLVFKGGTSLSKVFGVIDRFSEDIDLSLSPRFLGLDSPSDSASRTSIDRWAREAEARCAAALRSQVVPALAKGAEPVLGSRTASLFVQQGPLAEAQSDVLFHYPSVLPSGFDYVRRSVKLEFGSLTDQQPSGLHEVQPWIAEDIPGAFADWSCRVVALDVERTFWEKATIMHAEYHRPEERTTPDRFSRHYAELARLAEHPSGQAAVRLLELRERVVAWKSRYFSSAWVRFDLAHPGSFRLLSVAARLKDLARDYEAMRDMYLVEPPRFEIVLDALRQLETRINSEA